MVVAPPISTTVRPVAPSVVTGSKPFLRALARAACRTDAPDVPICVLVIEVDQGERIDEPIAEPILVEFERRIAGCIGATGQIARFDGDTFLAFAAAPFGKPETVALAGAIRAAVAQPIQNASTVFSASIGATVYPADASTAPELLFHAQTALRALRQAGGTGIKMFDFEHYRSRIARDLLSAAMLQAMHGGRLRLQYQPKIDLQTGAPTGAEALVRWHGTDGALRQPDAFLPHIHALDCMLVLDHYILTQAIAQAVLWGRAGIRPIISVNLCPRHFNDAGFVHVVTGILQCYPEFDPAFLALEVLETVAIEDTDSARAVFQQLRAMGIKIYLDDFGTGRSCAEFLKLFQVDAIKIDKCFIRDLPHGPNAMQDRAIIQASISVAAAFGATVIAEGIESAAAAHELRSLGCQLAQGFHFSPPLHPADFAEWYARKAQTPFQI